MSFEGKTILITGASSGIGRALADQLTQAGAFVVATARSGSVEQIDDRCAMALELDVLDLDRFRAVVDEVIEARGSIDYLFNNAGMAILGYAQDVDLIDFRRVVETNLFGTMHGIDAVYRRMLDQGSGHIVNIASLAGLVPLPGSAGYMASKHAVVGLSQCLRYEGAARGVKVTVVCPAAVDTPIYRTSKWVNLDYGEFQQALPSRPITAEVCARAILAGVRRNKAIITPSLAGTLLWWIHRHFPFVTRRLGASFDRAMTKIRAGQLAQREDASAGTG